MELDDQLTARLSEVFIQKIKSFKYDYKQPWIDTQLSPLNIDGRRYRGYFNNFFLNMYCMANNFQHPIFLTPKQAKDLNLNFKGVKCIPVFYFNPVVRPVSDDSPAIDYNQYLHLSLKEQSNYDVNIVSGYKRVMNVHQTDFLEKYPDKIDKIMQLPKFEHDYSFDYLDQMIRDNTWLCPIHEQLGNIAQYVLTYDDINVPSRTVVKNDYIDIPSRTQFPDVKSFYSTLLHEMAHSTMTQRNRIPTDKSKVCEAKEELVAELSAAIACMQFGITKEIREQSFGYVQGWLKALYDDPRFIVYAMKDAIKAVHLINQKVEEISQKKEIDISLPEKSEHQKIVVNLNRRLAQFKQTDSKNLKLKI